MTWQNTQAKQLFQMDAKGNLRQVSMGAANNPSKGKGKGKGDQNHKDPEGYQRVGGNGWKCADPECLADRRTKLNRGAMYNQAACKECGYCQTPKGAADAAAVRMTAEQTASAALIASKKAKAAAGTNQQTAADQPLSPTRRQKKNAARAAKEQAATSTGGAPPPPSAPQNQRQNTPQHPQQQPSGAPSAGGMAVSIDVEMTEVTSKRHMAFDVKKMEDWDLIAPLANKIQASLAKGVMPKAREQLLTIKERVEKLLADDPEATAGQTLADATARVEWLQKAHDFPPPGQNSEKWMANSKEELEKAKAALTKLQKRPTDAASSAAALKSGKSRYLLAVAKTKATVEAAQKSTIQHAQERKEDRAKARRQIDELEAAEEKELKDFLEVHRLRGLQRTQVQDEMIAELDARIAEVDTAEDTVAPDPKPAAEAQAAKAQGETDQTTIAQLAEQLKALQEQMQRANEETNKLRQEALVHQKQENAMRRYLLVVPVADQDLPEVVLPPQEDTGRLYYLQLHLLLSTWHSRGCVPFQEYHLREQFPDKAVLAGCVDTLLGSQARLWHQGDKGCPDSELIMPNQMAMVLLRQLEQVLPLESCEGTDTDDVERMTKRAMESYDAMVLNAKRLKLAAHA